MTPEQDVERRADVSALLMMLQRVHEDVQVLDRKLTEHTATELTNITEMVRDLMADAFPGGDANGHRKAHEADMKAITDRADFWKKMLFEVSRYGLFGVLGWLVYAAWVALLAGPPK